MFNIFKKKQKKGSLSASNERRAQAQYIDGLGNSRERIGIPYNATTIEPLTSYERVELIEMGRYLYANDGIVRGAIDDMARYSAPLVPQATTKDTEWNIEAEKYFEEWTANADILKRVDFYELQRLASVCIDRDGDVGMLMVRKKSGDYCVQLVESDKIIDHPKTIGEFEQGVKLDSYGSPTAFCVATKDEKGFKVIPSSMMSLFFNPERSQQTRGISSVAHAVAHIRDKKDILTFEKQGVKNLSSFSAVLKSEYDEADEDAFGLNETVTTDPNGDPTEITISQLQSGAIPVLRKGETLDSFQGNRPSTTFQGFLEFLVREFSVGMGLPYEFVWNTAGLTGPSQRFVMGKAQRKFNQRQSLLAPFVRKAWVLVIGQAVAEGKLPPVDGWERVRIQQPAKLTIDIGRESQQEREDVASGLMTRQEHFARRGLDWQTELSQQKKEVTALLQSAREIADEFGLPVGQVIPMISSMKEPVVEEGEGDE